MTTADDFLRQLNLCFAELKEAEELPAEFLASLRRTAVRRKDEVRAGRLPPEVIGSWIRRLPQLPEFLSRSGRTDGPSLDAAVEFLDGLTQMPKGSEEEEFTEHLHRLCCAYALESDLVNKLDQKRQQAMEGKISWNQLARYAADVFQKAANERGAKERFPSTMKAFRIYIEDMNLPQEEE